MNSAFVPINATDKDTPYLVGGDTVILYSKGPAYCTGPISPVVRQLPLIKSRTGVTGSATCASAAVSSITLTKDGKLEFILPSRQVKDNATIIVTATSLGGAAKPPFYTRDTPEQNEVDTRRTPASGYWQSDTVTFTLQLKIYGNDDPWIGGDMNVTAVKGQYFSDSFQCTTTLNWMSYYSFITTSMASGEMGSMMGEWIYGSVEVKPYGAPDVADAYMASGLTAAWPGVIEDYGLYANGPIKVFGVPTQTGIGHFTIAPMFDCLTNILIAEGWTAYGGQKRMEITVSIVDTLWPEEKTVIAIPGIRGLNKGVIVTGVEAGLLDLNGEYHWQGEWSSGRKKLIATKEYRNVSNTYIYTYAICYLRTSDFKGWVLHNITPKKNENGTLVVPEITVGTSEAYCRDEEGEVISVRIADKSYLCQDSGTLNKMPEYTGGCHMWYDGSKWKCTIDGTTYETIPTQAVPFQTAWLGGLCVRPQNVRIHPPTYNWSTALRLKSGDYYVSNEPGDASVKQFYDFVGWRYGQKLLMGEMSGYLMGNEHGTWLLGESYAGKGGFLPEWTSGPKPYPIIKRHDGYVLAAYAPPRDNEKVIPVSCERETKDNMPVLCHAKRPQRLILPTRCFGANTCCGIYEHFPKHWQLDPDDIYKAHYTLNENLMHGESVTNSSRSFSQGARCNREDDPLEPTKEFRKHSDYTYNYTYLNNYDGNINHEAPVVLNLKGVDDADRLIWLGFSEQDFDDDKFKTDIRIQPFTHDGKIVAWGELSASRKYPVTGYTSTKWTSRTWNAEEEKYVTDGYAEGRDIDYDETASVDVKKLSETEKVYPFESFMIGLTYSHPVINHSSTHSKSISGTGLSENTLEQVSESRTDTVNYSIVDNVFTGTRSKTWQLNKYTCTYDEDGKVDTEELVTESGSNSYEIHSPAVAGVSLTSEIPSGSLFESWSTSEARSTRNHTRTISASLD